MFKMFYLYSLSRHVSAYLMAILRRIVQNIKRSFYFYNGSVVFSTNDVCKLQAAKCRCFSLYYIFKYFIKILLLKYLNVKMVVEIIKLYKISRCHMALCSCVSSLLIFGVRPLFSYWCRGLIFGATCRVILQCFWASCVCLYYPVFHVLMLPNA
jgi:hypothetical protein